jgi:hypothetical protein
MPGPEKAAENSGAEALIFHGTANIREFYRNLFKSCPSKPASIGVSGGSKRRAFHDWAWVCMILHTRRKHNEREAISGNLWLTSFRGRWDKGSPDVEGRSTIPPGKSSHHQGVLL